MPISPETCSKVSSCSRLSGTRLMLPPSSLSLPSLLALGAPTMRNFVVRVAVGSFAASAEDETGGGVGAGGGGMPPDNAWCSTASMAPTFSLSSAALSFFLPPPTPTRRNLVVFAASCCAAGFDCGRAGALIGAFFLCTFVAAATAASIILAISCNRLLSKYLSLMHASMSHAKRWHLSAEHNSVSPASWYAINNCERSEHDASSPLLSKCFRHKRMTSMYAFLDVPMIFFNRFTLALAVRSARLDFIAAPLTLAPAFARADAVVVAPSPANQSSSNFNTVSSKSWSTLRNSVPFSSPYATMDGNACLRNNPASNAQHCRCTSVGSCRNNPASRDSCFKYELGTGVMCANTVKGTTFSSSIPIYGNDASRSDNNVPCGSVGTRLVTSASARDNISSYACARPTPSDPSKPSRGSQSLSSSAPSART
mmetsp:Transcript_6492/g.23525  ORF Transcript_6492/g.23525 Transcript_6492/m.23525 type:complete len:426 (+) Transcript_6492:1812-3089(+)